jgi:rhodanese-related sulfurtransferase
MPGHPAGERVMEKRMKKLSMFCIVLCAVFFIGFGSCFGISCEELRGLMDRKEKLTLIDCRDNASFRSGHILGAINIPARLCGIKSLPQVGRIVVYGDGIDELSVHEAVETLNRKPGIQAEMLEGGFLRWEALGYRSTRAKGFREEQLPYVSYEELEKMVLNNPDVVLLDVRNQGAQAEHGQSTRSLHTDIPADIPGAGPTDLTSTFPGARVVRLWSSVNTRGVSSGPQWSGELAVNNGEQSELYVVIDSGDGVAEEIARKLKAAGIRRFVILAGGEESLVRGRWRGSE